MRDIKKYRDKFTSSEWDVETLQMADEVITEINNETLKLSIYPNQYEIVTSEQMLDAYSLIGLPISYYHWKFGKDFAMNQSRYKRGQMGLSYEMVINSDPCISYNMEENTTCLMLLVMAHAGIGHNAFFKNNYLFKQWTQADAIIDYMVFAKKFVAKCEEKYGYEEEKIVLDACHSLMQYGVSKYKSPYKMSVNEEKERIEQMEEDNWLSSKDIWRTIPKKKKKKKKQKRYPENPEENILYFIEKNSPHLKPWQKELVRIVRKVAQYFYPQGQTKVLNEGCLVEGSLINTENGLMDIKFLVESKYNGKVWDGSNWRRVYDWFKHENKKRIKIITDKGISLYGGFDHKIFNKGEWVKLSNLNIGDEIKIDLSESEFTNQYVNIDYKRPKKLTVSQVCKLYKTSVETFKRFNDESYEYNMRVENVQKCRLVENYLNDQSHLPNMISKWKSYKIPNILDEKLAYWLGLLVGDGNTNFKNRIITLTNGDKNIIKIFNNLTNKLFGYNCRVVKDGNRWRCHINSQEILFFIQNYLDIKNGKSSSIKEVPKLILKSPKSVISSFIKGHFDADGCSSGLVVIVSNSHNLLKVEQELLLKMGIFSSLKKSNQDNTYRLTLCGINIKKFYQEIGTNIDYKKDNFEKIIENKKWFIDKDYVSTIEKIEIDYGTTYDFSVEKTHKYQCGGFINHNCATFTHFHLVNELYDRGYVDDGFMFEFFKHHSNVIYQPDFRSKFYSGLNPYTLGFNILMDVKRICEEPTDEDREWFPNLVGKDFLEEFHHIIENYKDDSFIMQYLSPKVIRDMKLFSIDDENESSHFVVSSIHNEYGYKKIRENLSNYYNRSRYTPDIQVYNVDIYGDRSLTLLYTPYNEMEIETKNAKDVLEYVRSLWGFPVKLIHIVDGKEKEIMSIE